MPSGYGQLRRTRERGTELVHRFVYEQIVGEIPAGMCVLHRCDVPACVRPSHLWIGTQLDNIADMRAKGRGAKPPVNWDGTHCREGHVLTHDNVYVTPSTGGRRCLTCMRERRRERWRTKRY